MFVTAFPHRRHLSSTAGRGGRAIHLSGAEYVVALAAITAGAVVQGSVGFGANIVAVPVMAVIAPDALPATLALVVIPLVAVMAVRERHALDRTGVTWITVGRIPGTVVGASVIAVVSADTLSVLLGAGVLLAVAMSVITTTIPVNGMTATTAGFASGAMGTATAIGGPPLALLYQHHEGPVLRATLAVAFAVGSVFSIVGLAIAGAIEGWHIVLAAALLPGLLVGLALSRHLVHRLDRGWLRPAVLAFAAVTSVIAIVQGL
jgi:uncharacterized membrane protein YfcA